MVYVPVDFVCAIWSNVYGVIFLDITKDGL